MHLEKLQTAFSEFVKAHEKYVDFANSCGEDKAKRYDEHFANMQAMVSSANDEFEDLRLQEEVTPYDSVSQHSGSVKSKSTTTSSARARAAAKKAALLAKASFLEKQQFLELKMEKELKQKKMELEIENQRQEAEMKEAQMRLRMELEMLQLEAEMSAAAAEEETLLKHMADAVGTQRPVTDKAAQQQFTMPPAPSHNGSTTLHAGTYSHQQSAVPPVVNHTLHSHSGLDSSQKRTILQLDIFKSHLLLQMSCQHQHLPLSSKPKFQH